MQIALLKAQIEKLKAEAISESGLGIERASRVNENKALAVERMAEAQKDRDLGTLHLTKALKELDSIDLDNIDKLWNLVQAFKHHEEAEEKKISENSKKDLTENIAKIQKKG